MVDITEFYLYLDFRYCFILLCPSRKSADNHTSSASYNISLYSTANGTK